MELFDFTKALFTPSLYSTCTTRDKKKNYFMAMRFISIKYPIQACEFSLLDIEQDRVMDFWASYLSRTFTSVPQWVYKKAKKVESTKPHPVYKVDEEAVAYYIRRYRLGTRDYEFLREIDPDGLLKDLKIIEKGLAERVGREREDDGDKQSDD